MSILMSAVFGVVQGLTEFLPISSSGHLILLHSITDYTPVDELAFDVALHVGTLAAIVWYFRADVAALVQTVLRWPSADRAARRLVLAIIAASIPAAASGFFLEEVITERLRGADIVAWSLMIGGVAIYAVDRWAASTRDVAGITPLRGLVVGFGQAIALIPGVSRSGATMAVGRLIGLSREGAARFAFLAAIPIMFGAGTQQLTAVDWGSVPGPAIAEFLVGGAAAALTGYVVIRWLIGYIAKHSFAAFAVYRILLGLIILFSGLR